MPTSETPRRDLYAEVTSRIIADMEAGIMPWARPWGSSAAITLPHNATTRRAYSGVNVLLLWGAAQERECTTSGWVTFKQALDSGGNVRRGEKATTIVYSDRFIPRAEADKAAQEGRDPRAAWLLKAYSVFNLDQCDGLDHLRIEALPVAERQQHEAGERVIRASGVPFHVGGNEAFYVPACDRITIPPQVSFHDQINYYRTAFHELGHATGHASRLDRKLLTGRGTKDYAREELVAEMCAAFMCASLGIVPTVRHADYLGSWLSVLREDNRAIFTAASQAAKAADWILARDAEQLVAA